MSEGTRGWDEYAPFYDWENARTVGRRDVAFWQRLAVAAEGPVLELGCGTGRILVPVARAGVRVTGIDRSEPMLARAKKRAARARVADRAMLIRGDIRQLPFAFDRRRAVSSARGRSTRADRAHDGFSLVMAPYGILQSLTREQDLRETLNAVARVTKRGGLFGLDLVPDLPRWAEYERRVSLRGKRSASTSLTLVESVRQDRRKKLTIFDQEYIERRGRTRQVHRFSLTFRTLSVTQMTRRLEHAGFAIEAVLGDYQGGPWDERADVWVVLAKRV